MMNLAASPVERSCQVHSLLPPSKDDLDTPTTTIEFADLFDGQCLARNIRNDEVPMASLALFFGEDTLAAIGSIAGFFEVFSGHFRCRSNGHETGAMFFFFADQHSALPVLAFNRSEDFFDLFARFVGGDDIGREAAQPKGSSTLYFNEFPDDEVSHVAEDKVSFYNFIDEVFAKFLVLFGASMEGIFETAPGEKIDGDIDLEDGSFAPPIAMPRAVFGIGGMEAMADGIFDKHSMKNGLEGVKFAFGLGEEFFAQTGGEGFEKKGDGPLVEALPKGLLGHFERFESSEAHDHLIEGSIAGEDGFNESEQKAIGGELATLMDDETGRDCQLVKFVEESF